MRRSYFQVWKGYKVMGRWFVALSMVGLGVSVSVAAGPVATTPKVPPGAQVVTITTDKDAGPSLPALWFPAFSQADPVASTGASQSAGPGVVNDRVNAKGHGGGGSHVPNTARPAVVLFHGCSGAFYRSGALNARFLTMAERMTAQGYGVLIPDSFASRGYDSICSVPLKKRPIGMTERVRDAYVALDYLSRRKDVQASNIGMIGFSHGAMTVLNSDDTNFPAVDPAVLTSARYNGAVAFYPGCAEVVRREPAFSARTPLLILIGEKDDWTFPEPCQRLASRASKAGQPVSIVTYPGAYHAFDMTQPARLRTDVKRGRNPDGVHVGGNPAAREDAYGRVDAFFEKRFGAQK